MQSYKSTVRSGCIVVGAPTSLRQDELIESEFVDELFACGDDLLDEEERAAFHQSIEEGFDDYEKSDTRDAFEFLAELKSAAARNTSITPKKSIS